MPVVKILMLEYLPHPGGQESLLNMLQVIKINVWVAVSATAQYKAINTRFFQH